MTQRVLCLIDHPADYQSGQGVQQLATHLRGELAVDIKTIGRGGDFRNPAAAMVALRGKRQRQWQILHAWGQRALHVAAFCRGQSATLPLVFTPTAEFSTADARWLRWAHRRGGQLRIICPSDSAMRLCMSHDVPQEICDAIRPGVKIGSEAFSAPETGSEAFSAFSARQQLRSALGFSPDDVVILAPGSTTGASGHWLAVWTTAILHVLDSKYKLLIWGAGPLAQRIKRFGEMQSRQNLVTLATQALGRNCQFDPIIPAADAVLDASVDPIASLPTLACMAAGLPIVTSGRSAAAEFLCDDRTASFAEAPTARLLARRLLELLRDPPRQRRLGDAARIEAQNFTPENFTQRHAKVYQALLTPHAAAV